MPKIAALLLLPMALFPERSCQLVSQRMRACMKQRLHSGRTMIIFAARCNRCVPWVLRGVGATDFRDVIGHFHGQRCYWPFHAERMLELRDNFRPQFCDFRLHLDDELHIGLLMLRPPM